MLKEEKKPQKALIVRCKAKNKSSKILDVSQAIAFKVAGIPKKNTLTTKQGEGGRRKISMKT